jgi:hypothetical protein
MERRVPVENRGPTHERYERRFPVVTEWVNTAAAAAAVDDGDVGNHAEAIEYEEAAIPGGIGRQSTRTWEYTPPSLHMDIRLLLTRTCIDLDLPHYLDKSTV